MRYTETIRLTGCRPFINPGTTPMTKMSEEADAAYAKLLEASRAYRHLGEAVRDALRETPDADASAADDWREAARKGLSAYTDAFTPGLDAWTQCLAAAPGLTRPLTEALERLPEPLGLADGHQERFREWTKCSAAYADAAAEYARLLQQAHAQALAKLDPCPAAPEADEDDPATLRRLYDAYVDQGEDAYAALVTDPAYLEAQARMTNAFLALRKQERDWLEDLCVALNLPSRRTLDATLQRLQATRRELRELRDRVEALEARSDAPR